MKIKKIITILLFAFVLASCTPTSTWRFVPPLRFGGALTMNTWDILLSAPFLIVACVGIMVALMNLPLKWENGALINKFIFLWFLFFMILSVTGIGLHGAYQSLRDHQSPPSWQTVEIAADFAFGYLFLSIVQLSVFIFCVTLVSLVIIPIYILMEKPIGNAFEIGFFICFGSFIILYILTFFGNCLFYSIGQQEQFALFGNLGQPITTNLIYENWFGNRCNVISIGKIDDIVSYPIAASKISFHVEEMLQNINLENNMSKVISYILLWLSPIADIFGFYIGFSTFMEKVAKRKRKKEEAG